MTPLHAGEQSGGADAPRFSADGGHSAAERPVSTETRGLRLAGDVFTHHPGLRGRPSRRVRRSPYDALVREMKERYRVAVRKWRKGMSGAAYELKYRDGRIKRLITAPRPAGPVSAAIFLHEVGHHAVGFRRYAPRVLEEYYVWQWTLREMTARGIPVDPRVLRHYRRSMFFYVRAAQRAGAVPLPAEVHGFMHWPG
ncbi:MAG TPA: hypothetical protein VH253_08625 [Phycisphaerae bacterium]|nr:hypothetical protein [Phycisphaerae bacterium]